MAFLLEHRFEEAKRIFDRSVANNSALTLTSRPAFLRSIRAIARRRAAISEGSRDAFLLRLTVSVGRRARHAATRYLRRASSWRKLKRPQSVPVAYQLAMARASTGKTVAALRELERSAERESQIFCLQYDPICDGIGVESGVRALEQQVGLQ